MGRSRIANQEYFHDFSLKCIIDIQVKTVNMCLNLTPGRGQS